MSALVKTTKSTHTNNGTIENTGSSTNTIDIHNYFGDYATTSLQTSSQYEKTVERTIEVRREFIANVKSQVELLIKVKVNKLQLMAFLSLSLFLSSVWVTQNHFRTLMNNEERKSRQFWEKRTQTTLISVLVRLSR